MQFLCFRTELPQKCLQHVFSAAAEQKDLLLWENLSASVPSGKNYTMDKPYSHRWKDQAFLWTLTLFSAVTCVKLSVPPTGCSAASSLNLVFTLPLFPVFLYGTISCYGKHICLWLKKKNVIRGRSEKVNLHILFLHVWKKLESGNLQWPLCCLISNVDELNALMIVWLTNVSSTNLSDFILNIPRSINKCWQCSAYSWSGPNGHWAFTVMLQRLANTSEIML